MTSLAAESNAAAEAGIVASAGPTPRTLKKRRKRPRFWINLVALVFSVVWIFPVYWMINTAFKPRTELLTVDPLFVPKHPTLHNFDVAINDTTFFTNLKNSVIVVFAAIIFAVILALFASAALSRFRFRGRRTIMVLILVVQMLPGAALLIPQFLIFNQANLLNNYFGLILAYVAAVLPFSIWVMRGFFVAIPVEVEEAAWMDGASTWRTLRSILFPLVLPGVISTSIFGFITAWNDYIVAYTFMKDSSKYTLPVWLNSFSTPTGGTDFGGQMAASVLFALPVVVFFLIIQRNLVAGMSAGAVKG
ncbi:carbohydrate ABC transporter permease [Luteimicrobium xylanilyticum]|uniref:ABC transporter permease protein ORF2 n=1 Tax=Luteimicrobium xylanilyticum TaxID=1133546 RepID=A0A5P9Q8P5_9MICO|nr:carbohydrate ABC transporter permease [Luteimicrobium xylanilyticum]QFU97739.1 Putative ABC transporter permease protein ORF2 [Luteimicrobium xylanilyticum]